MKKYTLMLIIMCAVMLTVMGGAQYILTRKDAEKNLMQKAQRDMEQSLRVATVKAEVETAVRNTIEEIEDSIDNPDAYYAIVTKLVRKNPEIIGAGVAFRRNYFQDKGRNGLFAPYCYDEQPAIGTKKRNARPQLRSVLLPMDYTDREWFTKSFKSGQSLWTSPYVSEIHKDHLILSTYVMPIREASGAVVGVFVADVPMEDVSLLAMDIHKGIFKNTHIILYIQLISLLSMMLIIWLAVRASHRYKEQHFDPEKERLVAELEKLRTVNRRLTQRNLDLAKKVQEYRQTTDTHFFG